MSEFFEDELARVLNTSRGAATTLAETSHELLTRLRETWGAAGRRAAGLPAGTGDRRRTRLAGPRHVGRDRARGRGRGAATSRRAVDPPAVLFVPTPPPAEDSRPRLAVHHDRRRRPHLRRRHPGDPTTTSR